jgi:hypothetical protein
VVGWKVEEGVDEECYDDWETDVGIGEVIDAG